MKVYQISYRKKLRNEGGLYTPYVFIKEEDAIQYILDRGYKETEVGETEDGEIIIEYVMPLSSGGTRDMYLYIEEMKLIGTLGEESQENYTSRDHFSISLLTDTAVMPTKKVEDAGWDVYADLGGKARIIIPARTPTKIPTGLAMAFSNDYCFNLGSERSSIAKHGITSLGGVIDSGYRGEVFVNLFSEKDAIIYHTNDIGVEIEYNEDLDILLIPSTKAVVQGLFQCVPKLTPKEEPYEKLKQYTSERGTGTLGSSGK